MNLTVLLPTAVQIRDEEENDGSGSFQNKNGKLDEREETLITLWRAGLCFFTVVPKDSRAESRKGTR